MGLFQGHILPDLFLIPNQPSSMPEKQIHAVKDKSWINQPRLMEVVTSHIYTLRVKEHFGIL